MKDMGSYALREYAQFDNADQESGSQRWHPWVPGSGSRDPHSFKQTCADAQKTGQSCFQNEAFWAQVCVNHHPSGVNST